MGAELSGGTDGHPAFPRLHPSQLKGGEPGAQMSVCPAQAERWQILALTSPFLHHPYLNPSWTGKESNHHLPSKVRDPGDSLNQAKQRASNCLVF